MALRIKRWTQMTAISDHGDRSSRGGPAHGGVAIVLVLVLVSALVIAASSAEAIGTRNTECVTGTDGFGIINSAAEWAQTFPAKRSGKLLTVELLNYARAPGGAGGDVDRSALRRRRKRDADGTGARIDHVPHRGHRDG